MATVPITINASLKREACNTAIHLTSLDSSKDKKKFRLRDIYRSNSDLNFDLYLTHLMDPVTQDLQ